ncbi:MAG TPA: autotransporter-associated beta strand repeat-containing protein, partial [Rhodocyclaceae bacterium]
MISTRLPFLTPALFALGFALSAGHAHAQAGQLVYVPNSASNDVSVYRTNADGSLTAVTTIAGINTAEQAAVRGDQAFAYVSASGSNQVKVIDTGTNTVVQTMATGTKPFGVAVSPDGTRVYVANVGAGVNTVSVFSADALTGQLSAPTTIAVGSNPRAIRFSSDGSRAYVANQDATGFGNGSVSVINTATNSVIATINTGGQLVDLAVNPAGTRVYVVDINNKVNVIDTATNTVVATPTATLNNPRGILVSADGSRFYVTNINTTSISQFDAATNASLGTVAAGNSPSWIALSPDGTAVYVAQGGTSNTVGIYSVSSGLLTGIGTIAAGTSPQSVGICGNGSAMLASGRTFIANTAGALGCFGSSASFTGGTLRINGAGLAITTPMTLGSAGGTIDTNGNSATVSGIIGGSGSLTKSGAGTLTLSGANTYTGATAVNTGTLQAGAANVFGSSGAVSVASGAVLDLNSFDQTLGSLAGAGNVALDSATLTAGGNNSSTTYSGVLSGSGSLTKSGTGTLTLSGANNYTGATTVNAGTLQAGAANVLGNNSAMTLASGAVLDLNNFDQTLGSLAGAGNVALGSATLTAGGNNSSTTYSGVLSGSGNLTKSGSGLLILNGVNTYTGTTTVSAGTLEVGDINTPGASIASNVTVNAGGTLRGHGSITGNVTSSGSIMPGGSIGTLTVNGNVVFNPGSIFAVELNPGETSLLNVTGGHTATLGGTVQVLAETGNYGFVTRYTILSADGGVSGTFGGVTSNLAFLTPSLSYDANNVYLNLLRNDVSLGAVAVTPNQRELGNALAAITSSGGANADMRSLLNTIVGFSAPQARSAYDSLSGVQNSYAGTLAMQQSRQFQEMLFDRLNDSSASQPLAVGFTQGSLLAYSGTDWSQFLIHHLGSAKRKGANASERGMWLRGFGGSGDVKATADASGTDYQSGGLALGIDGDLGDTA